MQELERRIKALKASLFLSFDNINHELHNMQEHSQVATLLACRQKFNIEYNLPIVQLPPTIFEDVIYQNKLKKSEVHSIKRNVTLAICL